MKKIIFYILSFIAPKTFSNFAYNIINNPQNKTFDYYQSRKLDNSNNNQLNAFKEIYLRKI